MNIANEPQDKTIHFYLDFISPYGYLAAMKVEAIAEKYGRQVQWHPMLLGVTVVNVMGLKPLMETPLKRDYLMHDVPRLASLFDLPIRFTLPPNPLPSARALYWVKQHYPALTGSFVKGVCKAIWQLGKDISDANVLVQIAQPLGINSDRLLAAISTKEVKAGLTREVDEAMAKGVFGTPTMIIDEQIIWGCDRFWMLEHWLRHGSWDSQPGLTSEAVTIE